MNKYVRMLTFVAVLGGVSSGLLVGAQLLTSDRITANADALLKSEILNAHKSIIISRIFMMCLQKIQPFTITTQRMTMKS